MGFALAERLLSERFGRDVVDHFTYVIAGDGCLMEGVGQEAITLAGHLGLGRLIVLFDDNGISIDGPTSLSTSEDHKKRFAAAGWHVLSVDGHDAEAVTRAIRKARNVTDKPSLIACKTVIGYGAPTKAGTAATHGSPLGKDEIAGARAKLGWSHGPFDIPEAIFSAWRKIGARGKSARRKWNKNLAAMAPRIAPSSTAARRATCRRRRRGDRRLQGQDRGRQAVLGHAQVEPGSARGHQSGAARHGRRLGRPHRLEQHQDRHAEGRLARRRHRPLHLLRHPRARDGRGDERHGAAWRRHPLRRHLHGVHRLLPPVDPPLGADGPAGHLRDDARFDRPRRGRPDPSAGRASPALRAIPNLQVLRPADAIETAECWQIALEARHAPSVIALTRQNLPTVRGAGDENLCAKGAYILAGEASAPIRLIASGSEVQLALAARDLLAQEGKEAAVVSMPSWELFAAQDDTYRAKVMGGDGTIRVACEAATGFGWERWLGPRARSWA